jgi:predicted RNase H-like HicB family nuclease
MSEKSKRSSATKAPKGRIDRPFTPEILARAKEIAARYTVLLQPEPGLGYLGRGLEFPHAMGDGRTPDECVSNTRDAFVAAVATMLEAGEVPPGPASNQNRTEQINVRVTAEEKLLLEEAARSKGFRGIGDFVRSTSLSTLR